MGFPSKHQLIAPGVSPPKLIRCKGRERSQTLCTVLEKPGDHRENVLKNFSRIKPERGT